MIPPPQGLRPIETEGGPGYATSDAARLLGCSDSKIRQMLAAGELETVRKGSTRLAKAADVLEYRRDFLIRIGARELFAEEDDRPPSTTSTGHPSSEDSLVVERDLLRAQVRRLEEKIRLLAAAQQAQVDSLLLDLSGPDLLAMRND